MRRFSIKRRKAPGRPWAARGAGPAWGQTSDHAGSKPSYIHLSDMRPAARFEAAQQWAASTQRPLPPSMRPRAPLEPPAPMSLRHRAAEYVDHGQPLGKLTVEKLLADPRFTPAQRKRLRGKAGSHGELPAGSAPRTQPRPKRPRTPAQRARFERDARQQARHLARAAR